MSEALPFATELAPPTSLTDDLGLTVDQTESGSIRQRSTYDAVYTDMELRWTMLSLADTETLRAWLRTNRMAEVTFTLGTVNYIGRIVGSPTIRYISPQWRTVSLNVRVTEVVA